MLHMNTFLVLSLFIKMEKVITYKCHKTMHTYTLKGLSPDGVLDIATFIVQVNEEVFFKREEKFSVSKIFKESPEK